MGRALSAYFVFAETARPAAAAELAAAAPPGTKVGVAAVAKRVGELWKALTDAERAEWKAKAVAKAAEKAEAEDGGNAASAPAPPAAPPALPASVVRRIMLLDPDMGRVSAGAARAVTAATEAWLGGLAGHAVRVAAETRRRTVRGGDVVTAARRDDRLVDACLPAALAGVLAREAGEAKAPSPPADAENAPPPPDAKGKRKAVGLPPGGAPARPVAAFFEPYRK